MTRNTNSRFEDGIKIPVSEGIPDPFTVSDIMRGGGSTSVSSQNTSVFFVFLGRCFLSDINCIKTVKLERVYRLCIVFF